MSENEYSNRILLLEDKIVHAGFNQMHVLQLRHRRHDGSWSPVISREVLERANSVAVLPYDPIADCIVLVEQYRPGTCVFSTGHRNTLSST